MSKTIYSVPKEFAANAHLSAEQYHALHERSISDPSRFWAEQAEKFITWSKPWKTTYTQNFKDLNVQWFPEGKLNACFHCVDRHLKDKKNQIALIWEGNHPKDSKSYSYKANLIDVMRGLHETHCVCK